MTIATKARPGDPDLSELTFAELRRLIRLVMRIRQLAVAVLAVGTGVAAILEPSAWLVTIALLAAVALVVVTVVDRRQRDDAISRGVVVYVLVSGLIAQTVLIAISGGIQSPIIAVYLPLMTVAGALIGQPRRLLPVAIPLVGILATFATLQLTGPSIAPEALRMCSSGSPNATWVVTLAIVLAVGGAFGGTMGTVVRRSLDRAIRGAYEARGEVVETMRGRNRELVELSGALAHELKNPLASVQGLTGLIARKLPEGSREAEHMVVLQGEIKRMGAILDEFLNFSRPVGGLAARPVAPADLVTRVLAIHRGLATERGVELRADIGSRRELVADARKLEQVLVNLLQNAIDATPPGGEVVVRVRDRADDGGVILTVEDTGSGLADEVRGRLFVRGATTKVAGSGLGLTIARAIVEQHGGRVTLEDRDGGGCVAMVELPAEPAEDTP